MTWFECFRCAGAWETECEHVHTTRPPHDKRDPFERARAELRRAAWWSRAWSLAYVWRERRINPNTRHMIEERRPGEKTILRATRVRVTNRQSWRVHKHEKQAWARLEELTQ